MSTLLLSDVHLRGLHDPTQHALLDFLKTVAFDELVVVGDLFDVWWTFSGAVRVDAVPVLACFMELIAQGRPVTWVGGNHDWAPNVEPLGIHVATEWRQVRGGAQLHAVHGDEGADPRLRNRLLEGALRSPLTKGVARVLGARRVFSIGERVAHTSRSMGGENLQAVLGRQNELADRLLGRADVVFVGHTHAPGMVKRPQGTLVNLGDWLQHRTFARVEADQVRLLRWTGTEEESMPEGPPQRWPRYMV